MPRIWEGFFVYGSGGSSCPCRPRGHCGKAGGSAGRLARHNTLDGAWLTTSNEDPAGHDDAGESYRSAPNDPVGRVVCWPTCVVMLSSDHTVVYPQTFYMDWNRLRVIIEWH